MEKYSITATKEDYYKVYNALEKLAEVLKMKLDWVKIKQSSLDQLQTLESILKRKIPVIEDSITVVNVKNIDIDNLKLKVTIAKNGEIFETYFQYIISSNSAHHSDIEFEQLMEVFDIDLDKIRDDIENRKLIIQ